MIMFQNRTELVIHFAIPGHQVTWQDIGRADYGQLEWQPINLAI